ncbi:MAG: dihydrodipicolinate synthase family protein [bacterium]|nr:dihydrodipicolinate synthase family protein [bacterium]
MLSQSKLELLKHGVVIPASPLALDANRKLDEKHQVALYRYYAAAGAGGIAVGVHTTQFEIRQPEFGLFEPLLELASNTIDTLSNKHQRAILKIAGVCGKTAQAVQEAALAANLGYDIALLSLSALKEATDSELIYHCRTVSQIIPIMGFYLQPAVGGRILSFDFWRKFAELDNVVAIKVAPFNRYQTLDVVRAVAMAGREHDIALYTGNDDNIIPDLLTPYSFTTNSGIKTLRFKGGLLGQWAVWTKTAVELLAEIHTIIDFNQPIPPTLLQKHIALTDANAVIFDAANSFAGCIPGINEILRRQGLMQYSHCLDPRLCLSPGQAVELDRIASEYPWLNDDEFVQSHLAEWLS